MQEQDQQNMIKVVKKNWELFVADSDRKTAANELGSQGEEPIDTSSFVFQKRAIAAAIVRVRATMGTSEEGSKAINGLFAADMALNRLHNT